MMNEESSFGASFQDQNARSNSSQAYLQRAASAVEEGDIVLGIHLYMAAYERALRENRIPNEAVLEGMSKAWDLAIRAKQRSLAEYIFEKLESFWTPEEMAAHAEELQQLAFDKLEEYGFDRDLVEDVADMVSQDLLDATDDVLCRFEDDIDHRTRLSSKKSVLPSSGFGAGSAQDEANAPSAGDVSSSRDQRLESERDRCDQSEHKHSASHTNETNEKASVAASKGKGNASSSNNNTSSGSSDGIEVTSTVVPPDSPLAAAFAQLSSLALGGSSEEPQEVTQQHFDYRSLVGFDKAIEAMHKLGVGRNNDPEFMRFLEMLNFRHGLPGMPGLGTLVFRSPAREDANCFMVATVGELGLPAIRMRLDRNAMGQVVLCVMASPNFKARLSGVSRSAFDSPTVVVLEDLDLWDLPFFDGSTDDVQSFLSIQLSRGAREALALVQAALTSPEATVLISASEPDDIDPFFWDLIGQHRVVDIDLPNDEERREIWRSEQAQHPSMRGLNVGQLVNFSRTLSRFEIYAISNEAVEEAYRESVARNTFCAVETGDILMRLSNFQPLDSEEYHQMEDMAVESFRNELSNIDDLLKE